MKLVRSSAIQSKALAILLSEPPNHMIAQSQSGTGETAAFVLATLSRINVDERNDFFYFLWKAGFLFNCDLCLFVSRSNYWFQFTLILDLSLEEVFPGQFLLKISIKTSPNISVCRLFLSSKIYKETSFYWFCSLSINRVNSSFEISGFRLRLVVFVWDNPQNQSL